MVTLDYQEKENDIWVHPHPIYSNYGMAFDSRGTGTVLRLVHGNLGTERLTVIEDHNAPIPVLSWYFLNIEVMLNSVNSGDTNIFASLTRIEYKDTQ